MPTINLTEDINNANRKIIDSDFDKKLEEYKSFEKNILSIESLFGNFSNQTNCNKFILL